MFTARFVDWEGEVVLSKGGVRMVLSWGWCCPCGAVRGWCCQVSGAVQGRCAVTGRMLSITGSDIITPLSPCEPEWQTGEKTLPCPKLSFAGGNKAKSLCTAVNISWQCQFWIIPCVHFQNGSSSTQKTPRSILHSHCLNLSFYLFSFSINWTEI